MKRIFCADDDPGMREVFPLIFSREGYEVTMFPTGEELLQNNLTPPDLFLLDKQLSGINGMDICRFLKNNPETRNIPVIIVSASRDLEHQAVSAGADDYIEKPFKLDHLLSLTRKYLSTSKDQHNVSVNHFNH